MPATGAPRSQPRAPFRVRAIAFDFDETLAENTVVAPAVEAALRRLSAAGVAVLLVTGRDLGDFNGERGAPLCDPRLFTRIVAENGSLIWDPATGVHTLIGTPVTTEMVAAMLAGGVTPLSVGHCSLSTFSTMIDPAQAVIDTRGLQLKAIVNKAWVNYVSPWVDKGVGLRTVLAQLGIDPADTVAVGDGENDFELLAAAGIGVAVANADPRLARVAQLRTTGARGDGVVELVTAILARSLQSPQARPAAGAPPRIAPHHRPGPTHRRGVA